MKKQEREVKWRGRDYSKTRCYICSISIQTGKTSRGKKSKYCMLEKQKSILHTKKCKINTYRKEPSVPLESILFWGWLFDVGVGVEPVGNIILRLRGNQPRERNAIHATTARREGGGGRNRSTGYVMSRNSILQE